MNTPARFVVRLLTWIITILVPLALLMTSIRLLLLPVFPEIEYRMPGFPADPYGFTFQDRLKWSKPSIEYLVNNADPSYLSDLRLPDGSPLYNEREMSHMVDVKTLVQNMIKGWILVLALLLASAFWAWRTGWLRDYLRAVAHGGWLTAGLIVAILVAVAVSFTALFTTFHRLFFTGDTWLFLYSDSLIRLFPIRFWQDCFIYMGIFSLLGGLALGWGLRKK